VSGKRSPYRTQAARVADDAIAQRVKAMEQDDAVWLRFCQNVLDGALIGAERPHRNRHVEREAMFDFWQRQGLSINAATARYAALEVEWSASPQRLLFASRYHIGTSFGPAFIDEALNGPLLPPPGGFPLPGPDADPRLNPFPPMVRGEPFAPPSVRADLRLLLVWVEWLGERRHWPELVNDDNRRAVTRARRRIRKPPNI